MEQDCVLRVDPGAPDREILERVAAIVRAGGVVAFPTETFYGLGAAALNPRGVRRVFVLKRRPQVKPLPVLVDSVEMAATIVTEIPPRARALIERHWPGPLTLVLRARAIVPEELMGSTGTIGIRISAHPAARGLVAALGAPITAPSANRTRQEPPTTARQVLDDFGTELDAVLDGGATPGGLPSTVLDVTVDPARVIREGAVRL